jgi:hypothetical protein
MANLGIKKITLLNLLLLFVYKIGLDVSYFFVIEKNWSYSGFILVPNSLKLIESYFLLTLVFIVLPKLRKAISSFVVWFLFLLSYVPLLTFYSFTDGSRAYVYAATLFWLLICLLMLIPVPIFRPVRRTQAGMLGYMLIILISLTILYLLYSYVGLFLNIDLGKIYDIRLQFAAKNVPLSGYFFDWFAYVAGPISFALFIARKNWFYAVVAIVLELLLFSATGNRTYLFSLPFVAILMWIARRKNSFGWLAGGLAGIVTFGMVSKFLLNDVWITSLFTRRLLLVPAQISFYYYDFFSKNGFVFLSHSIFRSFILYPYSLDPSHLIGKFYFRDPQVSANNGLYGDAFMNFGFFGVTIIWPIILAVILKILDGASRNKDIALLVAAIAMPAIALVNSALLTCLLTHGLLLAILFVYLLPVKKGAENENL